MIEKIIKYEVSGSSTSTHLGHNPVSISILQPDGAIQICFARSLLGVVGKKIN